jgi:GT2 family glycosyltransferase
MKIGFVILTYVNYQDTIHCVKSLIEALSSPVSGSCSVDIVLVDNDSPNGAADQLVNFGKYLEKPPWIHLTLLRSSENLGYGNGNNLGLERLFRSLECAVVFVMNNDVIVHSMDTNLLVHELESKNGDAWGCHILNEASHDTEYYGGAIFNRFFFNSRRVLSRGEVARITGNEGFYISGAFLGFSRAAYEKVGPFYESFFLYFEEIEWFYRARQKLGRNLNIVVLEGITLRHQVGGSTGNSEFGTQKSDVAEYYSARARILFSRKVARLYLPNAICYNLTLAIHRFLIGYKRNVGIIIIATLRGILGEKGRHRSL